MSIEPTPRKKYHWCGTEPSNDANEADQTPVAVNMSSAPEEARQYPCITQKGLKPTFGVPPHDGREIRQHHGPEIVVGVENLIPRWTADKTNPTKLFYFVVRTGFPSEADKK
jgi:hypothetical protein